MSDDYQLFIEAMQKLEAASPEEKAPMSDAEVFEICVRIVSNKLITEGAELLQVNSGLNSLPAIWFKRNDRLNYIVITTARYPEKALPPDNTQAIQQHLFDQNANGYWVGVSLAHEFEVFDPEANEGMTLMKGFGVLPAVSDPVDLSSL